MSETLSLSPWQTRETQWSTPSNQLRRAVEFVSNGTRVIYKYNLTPTGWEHDQTDIVVKSGPYWLISFHDAAGNYLVPDHIPQGEFRLLSPEASSKILTEVQAVYAKITPGTDSSVG